MPDYKIETLSEGRAVLLNIRGEIADIVLELNRAKNNTEWQKLSDKKYELVKARRFVQAQMGKIIRERQTHGAR